MDAREGNAVALQPGQQLGDHHRIIEEIGHGGMSTVYSALDTRLNREDAIKVMRPQYASDPTFAARFKQEAQAAASLHSPHIVEIYDWNRDNGDYYIVMERLNGADLKQIIERRGAIEGEAVAKIASHVCSALNVAHANDIIHRDIKPNNIMLVKGGDVKVMDFGIAKSKNSNLTTDNSVWGTANYVSPEQVQGKELSPASDIYSLGIVMYEAVTGQLPFTGEDAISVALKQINEQPVPPSELVDIDAQLEDIILKCMEKDPADRYQSALDLRRDLISYLEFCRSGHDSQPTTPIEPTRRITRGAVAKEQEAPRNISFDQDEDAGLLSTLGTPVKIALLLLAALIIGAVGLGVTYATGAFAVKTATVPLLQGGTLDEAKARLEEANLVLGDVEEVWGTEEDKGKVIDQSPAAMAEVDLESKVDLKVSKGEKPIEKVSVPSLIGLTADEARQALEDIGLVADQQQAYSASVEKDRVVSQATDANKEVEIGSTVSYVVSLGVETVAVPDVSGMTQDKATSVLEAQGFGVAVETVEDEGTEGIVRNYYPEERQNKGATITICITRKPEVKVIEVPVVNGLSEENAKAILQERGFAVSTSTQEVSSGAGYEDGVVLTYAPTGEQPEGTTVHIVITKLKAEEKPATSGSDQQGGSTGTSTGNDQGDGKQEGKTEP